MWIFRLGFLKKYGRDSIYVLSNAKLIHNHSPSGRLLGYSLEAHRRIVNLYMLYKHFGDTPLNIIVFVWWNIGEIIEYLMSGILGRRFRDNLKNIITILRAMQFTLRNLSRIRRGDILNLQM